MGLKHVEKCLLGIDCIARRGNVANRSLHEIDVIGIDVQRKNHIIGLFFIFFVFDSRKIIERKSIV